MNYHKYAILIKDGGPDFDRCMSILFKKGFVFTQKRCKTLEELHKNWDCWASWLVLKMGIDEECKMIVHAGGFAEYDEIIISFDNFLKLKW